MSSAIKHQIIQLILICLLPGVFFYSWYKSTLEEKDDQVKDIQEYSIPERFLATLSALIMLTSIAWFPIVSYFVLPVFLFNYVPILVVFTEKVINVR